jgi:hypothetical protein
VYFVTVLGLFVSRAKWGKRSQPNSNYGLVWSPLVFCCLVGVIVLQSAITHPLEFTSIMVFLGVFSGLYYKGWLGPGAVAASTGVGM